MHHLLTRIQKKSFCTFGNLRKQSESTTLIFYTYHVIQYRSEAHRSPQKPETIKTIHTYHCKTKRLQSQQKPDKHNPQQKYRCTHYKYIALCSKTHKNNIFTLCNIPSCNTVQPMLSCSHNEARQATPKGAVYLQSLSVS